MPTVASAAQPKRCMAVPSVREVCLLGIAWRSSGWTSSDRISISGRVYRVEAVQPRLGVEEGTQRYVHLAAESQAGTLIRLRG